MKISKVKKNIYQSYYFSIELQNNKIWINDDK